MKPHHGNITLWYQYWPSFLSISIYIFVPMYLCMYAPFIYVDGKMEEAIVSEELTSQQFTAGEAYMADQQPPACKYHHPHSHQTGHLVFAGVCVCVCLTQDCNLPLRQQSAHLPTPQLCFSLPSLSPPPLSLSPPPSLSPPLSPLPLPSSLLSPSLPPSLPLLSLCVSMNSPHFLFPPPTLTGILWWVILSAPYAGTRHTGLWLAGCVFISNFYMISGFVARDDLRGDNPWPEWEAQGRKYLSL